MNPDKPCSSARAWDCRRNCPGLQTTHPEPTPPSPSSVDQPRQSVWLSVLRANGTYRLPRSACQWSDACPSINFRSPSGSFNSTVVLFTPGPIGFGHVWNPEVTSASNVIVTECDP